jgi:hypothetical protein
MQSRRFPPPWSVEQQDACFVVRDHNGPALDVSRCFCLHVTVENSGLTL